MSDILLRFHNESTPLHQTKYNQNTIRIQSEYNRNTIGIHSFHERGVLGGLPPKDIVERVHEILLGLGPLQPDLVL